MKRRQFIALGGLALALTPLRAVAPDRPSDQPAVPLAETLTMTAALQTLDQLRAAQVTNRGTWNLYQVYTHLAQSVEYSMSGYPEHRSWLFKNSVGSIAFAVFAVKGSMNHNLEEAIPGAPPLQPVGDAEQALQRLRQSLLVFRDFDGPLQPHFAYGELSWREYEQAHVMHLNNHLEAFVQSG